MSEKERPQFQNVEGPPPWVQEATGPTGRRDPSDDDPASEGELRLAIGANDGVVQVHFGTLIMRLGLTPEQARLIGEMLIRSGCSIDGKPFELKIGG